MCMVILSSAGDVGHKSAYDLVSTSLVPSLSAPQIFIAYSMKNRGGKYGRIRHDNASRNVMEASLVVYLRRTLRNTYGFDYEYILAG